MKYLLSIIFFACFTASHAQEKVESDSLSEEPKDHYQLYLAPTYTANQFVETIASFAGISVGLTFRTKFDVGIYYHASLDNFKKRIIFPTNFKYDQMNAGVRLKYMFLDKSIRPLVGVGIQYAQMSWKAEGDLGDVFTDHIFIYDAYFGGIWRLSNIVRVQASIGYAFPGELKLVGLERQDYQGIRFDLAIKFKVFSF